VIVCPITDNLQYEVQLQFAGISNKLAVVCVVKCTTNACYQRGGRQGVIGGLSGRGARSFETGAHDAALPLRGELPPGWHEGVKRYRACESRPISSVHSVAPDFIERSAGPSRPSRARWAGARRCRA